MTQQPFSTRGVVDLSALRTPPGAGTAGGSSAGGSPAGGSGGGSFVFDVTEANFAARVVEQSQTVPVVLDLWADWCEPCKQLSPVLERLAAADGGRWLLAKLDVEANPRLASAFGAQSIPAVLAVVAGQPVPLFTGAMPEATVRRYLDELLRLAAEHGVTGRAAGGDAAPEVADEEPALPPLVEKALDAMDRGDFDAAAAAYREALAENPADEMARLGLAQVELVRRIDGVDPQTAVDRAASEPQNLDAALLAADVEVVSDQVEAAFGRLIGLVRVTAGAERDRVREHLLGLFDVVGAEDPRVIKGRQQLTSALF